MASIEQLLRLSFLLPCDSQDRNKAPSTEILRARHGSRHRIRRGKGRHLEALVDTCEALPEARGPSSVLYEGSRHLEVLRTWSREASTGLLIDSPYQWIIIGGALSTQPLATFDAEMWRPGPAVIPVPGRNITAFTPLHPPSPPFIPLHPPIPPQSSAPPRFPPIFALAVPLTPKDY